jgi:hypothetical protein
VEQHDREQRTRFRRPQRNATALEEDLERPKDLKLDRGDRS